MLRALGIFRELQNSPNRETDDALILKAVLEQLDNIGLRTRAVTPEELDRMDAGSAQWDIVLPMCEAYPRIKRLAEARKLSRALWVNPPETVLNCYRLRMIPAMRGEPRVVFPPSELRRVEDGPGEAPGFGRPPEEVQAAGGWWLKRGDVHNTCDRDVVRARSWAEAEAVLRDFAAREITHYAVQPHIDGDLVKFYGVGPGHWFTWFYHDPVRARRHPFEVDALAASAQAGAEALELCVFGGDGIVSADGTVTIIDLNSWPSFALVRQEAAVQIAWYLQRRLKQAARPA